MPIFPYDDEEERRRRMLTPGINPEAPMPRVIPRPGGGIPGAEMPAPPVEFDRPTRLQRFESEREGFMRGTPGRGKSALTGALEGLAGGGGLIGAITGAAGGAIDPTGLRERQFNRKIRPQIEERFRFEDADIAAQRQGQQDALNNQYRTAQIGELESQAYKNRMPPAAPPETFENASGLGIYNKRTGQVTTPAPPQQPREPAPNYEFDVDRLPYNINNPAERKKYESLPRGKRVKPEKAGGGGKAKKETKVVSRSQVEKAADEHFGGDDSEAAAAFVRKGYRIVN